MLGMTTIELGADLKKLLVLLMSVVTLLASMHFYRSVNYRCDFIVGTCNAATPACSIRTRMLALMF